MNIQKLNFILIKIIYFAVFAILIYLVTNYYIFNKINYFPDFEEGWTIQQITIKNAWNILNKFIAFIVILPILYSLLYRFIPFSKTTINVNQKPLLILIVLLLLFISAYAAYEIWALYDYDDYMWKLYFEGASGEKHLYKGVVVRYICSLCDEDGLTSTYNFIINSYLKINSVLLAFITLLSKAVIYCEKGLAFINAALISATCVLFPSFYIFDSVYVAFVLYLILFFFGVLLGAVWYILCKAIKSL